MFVKKCDQIIKLNNWRLLIRFAKYSLHIMDQIINHPLYKSHNIDSAMSSLWDFYKKRFLSLFAISFAMSLVIQYFSTFINIQEISSLTDPMEIFNKMKEMVLPIILVSVVNLLFNTILQYYVIYNPLDRANNIFVSALTSVNFPEANNSSNPWDS